MSLVMTLPRSCRSTTRWARWARWARPSVILRLGLILSLASALGAGCAAGQPGLAAHELEHVARAAPRWDASQREAQALRALAQADGSLEGYVQVALARHPKLQAEHAQWRAQLQSAQAAYAWPEPTISYGLMLSQGDWSTLGLRAQQVSVGQALPWFERPGLSRQAGLAAARAQQHRHSAALLLMRAEIAQSYWGIWRLQGQRQWLERQLVTLEAVARAVAGRVEAGRASQAQLLQVQLQQTRQRDALARLDAQLEQAVEALRESLGVVDAQVALPVQPAASPAARQVDEAEEVLIQAAVAHPELLILQSLIEQRQREVALARTQRLPDMMFSLSYMQEDAAVMAGLQPPSGGHGQAEPMGPMLMGMVGLKIPIWWDRYQAQIDAAQAREAADRARLEAARAQAAAEVRRLLVALREDARAVRVIERALMPQAEGALEAALSAFESQNGGFAEVSLAQRELLQLGLERVSVLGRMEQTLAQLERRVGRPVLTRQELDR